MATIWPSDKRQAILWNYEVFLESGEIIQGTRWGTEHRVTKQLMQEHPTAKGVAVEPHQPTRRD